MEISKLFRFDRKIFIENLTSSLAWFGTIGGFILTLYPLSNNTIFGLQKWAVFILIIIVAVLLAIIKSYPKSSISLQLTKQVRVNIKFADIFESETNIVIPFNEYFDTIVDDVIISKNTLHGKFVDSCYGSNVEELDTQIEEKLISITDYKVNNERSKGKKKKYPLGTTIKIGHKGKNYFLFAFTEFNEHNKAGSSNIAYQNTIHLLLDFIHNNSQGYSVNVPLIGAGPSGIGLSKQELLEYLIFAIKMHQGLTVSGDINIILYKSVRNEIDLNKILYLNRFN